MKESFRLTENKIIAVIICAVFVTLAALTGCGAVATTGEMSAAGPDEGDAKATDFGQSDMSSALSDEQANLMAEYDLMEAEDAAEISTASDEEGVAKDESEESAGGGNDVTIIMVGDMLMHTPVEKAAYDPDTEKYNYDFIFANTIDDIQAADIAIVNEEVIIGGEELGVSGYPGFNAPYELGDDLVEAGFDVICHATNHALDKGAKGISNCTGYWNEEHPDIEMLGIHESAEDAGKMCILEVNGIKIAVLNYTYGTNGIPLPADMPYAVDELSEEKVIADLAKAEEAADFTVVVPHWGTEYSLKVSESQKKWAQIMATNGADLIIGAHPHVIEPIEWVEADSEGDKADAKNRALCYYSLGNYVNWTSGTGAGVAARMLGGMAQVTLSKDESGEVYISHYGVEPLVCHVERGRENVTVYRLADYSEELGQRNEIRAQDPAFSYEYVADLARDIWGDVTEGIDEEHR